MEDNQDTIRRSYLLHWVFKIRNLQSVLALLSKELGLKVLRHEEFNSACEASCNGNFENAWSKTMVGLGDELSHFALELVYNYSKRDEYKKHKGFVNLEFYQTNSNSDCNYNQFKMENYSIANFSKNYCKDYLKVLTNDFTINDFENDFKFLTLEVKNLDKSVEYYEKILNMNIYSKERIINTDNFKNQLSEEFVVNNMRKFCILGYEKNKTLLKLVQCEADSEIYQSEDSGRMAFACDVDVFEIKKKIELNDEKILHEPVILKTEGKSDVKVIILLDKDEYEICFVERDGFRDLSTLYEGVDFIDWEMRNAILKKLNSY